MRRAVSFQSPTVPNREVHLVPVYRPGLDSLTACGVKFNSWEGMVWPSGISKVNCRQCLAKKP